MRDRILIEGFTPTEILHFPPEEIALYFDKPLVLHIGTAEVLSTFRRVGQRLVVELGHIDGGGEGVLPTLWLLATRYAAQQGLEEVEWIVHAVSCATPNLKLRRVLERRGFVVKEVTGVGFAYHRLQPVPSLTG